MPFLKNPEKQPIENNTFADQYHEIVKTGVPNKQDTFNLKQPSIFEEVDSVTTYEVSCASLERK